MEKAPTVYDVAARAGVSIATVSRVLRQPDVVRDVTRDRVFEAVRALGYVPSGAARGLAARRTGVLGLLLPAHDQPRDPAPRVFPAGGRVELVRDADDADAAAQHNLYYDEVLLGAESEAWTAGFALMVAAGNGVRRSDVADVVGRVDGLVAVANAADDEVLVQASRRVPVVLIAEPSPSRPFAHVTVSNREAMVALVGHLADEHAVRRLVFLGGPSASPDAGERRAGVEQAAAERGLEVELVAGDFSRGSGRAVARDLIARGREALPDAVVAANDQAALGVLEELGRAGIRVPGDVRVTGFDGIDGAAAAGLTTVRQPMFGLGSTAVRTLLDAFGRGDRGADSVRLAVDVVLRASCGCAPAPR